MALFDLHDGDGSAALKDSIASRIEREGPITFRDFMEAALYDPDFGYYVKCDPGQDYQSSPNVHAVFGACLGLQIAEVWQRLGRPQRFDVLEAGAGSGRLAGDIVRWAREHEPGLFAALRYVIQDVTYTPERSATILHTLGLPEDRVTAVTEMEEAGTVRGCILSNELIDAFPVHRVKVQDGHLFELRVGYQSGSFVEVQAEPLPEVKAYFERLGILPGEGCEAEVNLEAPAWLARAQALLEQGYVLTLDYGYEADQLYAPWRKQGTLLTFYRQTSGSDPFRRVGRQDITASVDFTTLMRQGEALGLETLGLTTQAEFLSALGVGEALARRPEPSQLEAYYALRRAVIELTDPTGLGRIKVLAQGRGVSAEPLAGFVVKGVASA